MKTELAQSDELLLQCRSVRMFLAEEEEEEEEASIVVSLSDITERKRAEEERFRLLQVLESSLNEVYIFEPQTLRFQYVSPGALRNLGYTREAMSAMTPLDLKPEFSQSSFRNLIAPLVRHEKEKLVFQAHHRRADNSLYPVETHLQLSEADGKRAFLAIVLDVTERKQAEEALRQSEDKYRTIFEESKDVLYMSTVDGRFIDINPAGVELFGYVTKDDLLRVNMRDLYINLQDRTDFQQAIAQRGFAKDWELALRKKDGGRISVQATTTVQRDASGHVVAYRGVLRDVTQQRKLKEQLIQAQKLESLGTLAGGIAHDFNNILGIVLTHASLLEVHTADKEKLSQTGEAIIRATMRGASVVKQLLTFARKTETLFESVSINDMVKEIKKLMQETFPKTITISTSLQQDVPAVVADASQIHQVLLNLCVNARDAMPKRGTLSISTKTIEGEAVSSRFANATAQRYVQLEVADTGIGMDESTRLRVFEPFFTTKGLGKGTGLGLSVVFGIVENHSGFIDVRSAPGEGTSFTVYLPVPERALEVSQRAGEVLAEIVGGTETILVIEDEEMLREAVKAVLVSKGYTVLTAEDGMQGMEMYQSLHDQISIVLSDLGLPALSGQDVFKRIREINPQAKIILASGFIDPELKSEMYKAGAKQFIQKPYSRDEILQKIREVIDTNG